MSKTSMQLSILLFGIVLWFLPVPDGLKPQAWHLFAIFITTIIAVILNAMSIFTSSIFAVSIAVLTKTLEPAEAFSGFSEGFILLIVTSFLIARGVVKSGLGKRIAFMIIKRFGKSSLGLAYSIIAADMLIAPAFPSNTARSGVLFPIVNSLASDSGSNVEDGTRKKLGSFLMMSSMAGITISSAMWLTAMAANPAGAAIAKKFHVEITYMTWVTAAIGPVLVLFFLMPWVIYKIYPPEIKSTPEAPQAAAEELKKMGNMSAKEWTMSAVFVIMVFLWVMSGSWGIDKTAIAFLGLATLMITDIFTLEDLKHEGGALETLLWFGILYTMSVYLNEFGFMTWIGAFIADYVSGFSWPIVYISLIVSYVLIHYFFVSQSAQMLALYGVFLEVGLQAGVPAMLLALMLLFATNFNAIITPQGSSANAIYAGSNYITAGEIYKVGGIITLLNTVVFLTVGTAWILLVT